MDMNGFSPGVAEELGHYVYRLIDPRDGQTFYVGRGQKNRVFDHINNDLKRDEGRNDLSLKLETIRKIRRAGLRPTHIIHRHGMTRDAAIEVEAALIDMFPALTNIAPGQDSQQRGPRTPNSWKTAIEPRS